MDKALCNHALPNVSMGMLGSSRYVLPKLFNMFAIQMQ